MLFIILSRAVRGYWIQILFHSIVIWNRFFEYLIVSEIFHVYHKVNTGSFVYIYYSICLSMELPDKYPFLALPLGNKREQAFEKYFPILEEYSIRYGHTNIPQTGPA